MSWTVRALILIYVDAHDGQWCSLDWLAGRVLASQTVVREQCDLLVQANLLQAHVVNGRPCYGVHADAESGVVA